MHLRIPDETMQSLVGTDQIQSYTLLSFLVFLSAPIADSMHEFDGILFCLWRPFIKFFGEMSGLVPEQTKLLCKIINFGSFHNIYSRKTLIGRQFTKRVIILSHLKVPKCENFHRTDFFDFFTIKPLWVGDFRAQIKN